MQLLTRVKRLVALCALVILSGVAVVPAHVAHAETICTTTQLAPGWDAPLFYPSLSGLNAALTTSDNQVLFESPAYAQIATINEYYASQGANIDGNYVVSEFLNTVTGSHELYIYDIANGTTTVLAPPNNGERYVAPIVSGDKVGFAYYHPLEVGETIDFMLYDTTNDTLTNITNFDNTSAIAVGGGTRLPYHDMNDTTVVYTYQITSNYALHVAIYDIATGVTTQIEVDETVTQEVLGRVSGDLVSFTGADGDFNQSTHAYQISTGTVIDVFPMDPNIVSLAVGTNGTHVFYLTEDDDISVYLYDVATASTTTIDSNVSYVLLASYGDIEGDYLLYGKDDAYVPPATLSRTDSGKMLDLSGTMLDLSGTMSDLSGAMSDLSGASALLRLSVAQDQAAQRVSVAYNVYRYQISSDEIVKVTTDGSDTVANYFYDVTDEGYVSYTKSAGNSFAYRWGCGENLGSFLLQSPANNSLVTDTSAVTTVTWTPTENADLYAWEVYQAGSSLRAPFISVSAVDAAAFCDASLCTLPVDLTGIPDGDYVWNVKAFNAGHESFSDNGYYTFTIDSGAGDNLIANPGFEFSLEPVWNANKNAKIKCNTPDKTFALAGSCALQVKVMATPPKGKAKQLVDLTGLTLGAGDTLNISGYVDTSSAARVKVVAKHPVVDPENKTKDKVAVRVDAGEGFVNFSDSVDLTNDVDVLKVIVKGISGKSFVDALSLTVSDTPAPLSANGAEALPLPAAPDGFRK